MNIAATLSRDRTLFNVSVYQRLADETRSTQERDINMGLLLYTSQVISDTTYNKSPKKAWIGRSRRLPCLGCTTGTKPSDLVQFGSCEASERDLLGIAKFNFCNSLVWKYFGGKHY
jgi:hypothetical protein